MPIFDASPLDRADGDAKSLRDVLGPAKRPPLHAREMREAAHRSARDRKVSATDEGAEQLVDALQKTASPVRELIRRLHSPV